MVFTAKVFSVYEDSYMSCDGKGSNKLNDTNQNNYSLYDLLTMDQAQMEILQSKILRR